MSAKDTRLQRCVMAQLEGGVGTGSGAESGSGTMLYQGSEMTVFP